MSTTPTWLHSLIWDTAAWQADCFAMLYRTLLFIDTQAFWLLPVAMVSGAEHELDYYTRPNRYTLDSYFAYLNQLWGDR